MPPPSSRAESRACPEPCRRGLRFRRLPRAIASSAAESGDEMCLAVSIRHPERSRGTPDSASHLAQFEVQSSWRRRLALRRARTPCFLYNPKLQVAALIPVDKEALSCEKRSITSSTAFEVTSKRRKGFPSETQVKRGERLVHGSKELIEKLGRNDLCPCGSGRCLQAMLP